MILMGQDMRVALFLTGRLYDDAITLSGILAVYTYTFFVCVDFVCFLGLMNRSLGLTISQRFPL